MKQLYLMAMAAGLLAVLSVQQASAQYGNGIPMSPSGSDVSENMFKRCAELGISRVQCNDTSILQAERMDLVTKSKEKGSGTSMIATGLGQMVFFIGAIGAVFGGIAGAFYLKGRRPREVPV